MQSDHHSSFTRALLIAVLLGVLGGGERASAQCAAADLSDNGVVDGTDLASLLSAWGTNNADADINDDGMVDGADLTLVLVSWGPCIVVPPWATLVEAYANPSVVTDANLRAAITATGLAWRVRDTNSQIEMMLIPPGTFNMGCSASEQWFCGGDEDPVHQVTLTSAYYMGRYEVTQAQWTARMGSNPSGFQSASAEVPAAHVPQRPVETVSWNTVQSFLSGTGMRLPTEAEWEYACRAGTTTAFHGFEGQSAGTNIDSLVPNIAWISPEASSQTRPVGGKLGNGFGLHDMLGNVWEWVNDWWYPGYYSVSPAVNPQGPSIGPGRVLRGGSWYEISNMSRTSARLHITEIYAGIYLGFRVARNP